MPKKQSGYSISRLESLKTQCLRTRPLLRNTNKLKTVFLVLVYLSHCFLQLLMHAGGPFKQTHITLTMPILKRTLKTSLEAETQAWFSHLKADDNDAALNQKLALLPPPTEVHEIAAITVWRLCGEVPLEVWYHRRKQWSPTPHSNQVIDALYKNQRHSCQQSILQTGVMPSKFSSPPC